MWLSNFININTDKKLTYSGWYYLEGQILGPTASNYKHLYGIMEPDFTPKFTQIVQYTDAYLFLKNQGTTNNVIYAVNNNVATITSL